jgi:3',5'-cyclic AMP phosphodiesterase CpdA
MIIAHMSDTHISAPGYATCNVAPMADNLARCVAHINQARPRVDLALLTGDITHHGRADEARHAASILAKLDMPLRIVPGNHDDRSALAEAFGPTICPRQSSGSIDYVIDEFSLRIIALDSLHTGYPGGRLSAAQLDWLRSALAAGGAKPTLIMAHHPPLNLGVPETDQDGFEGAKTLGDILAGYRNIERFLCGHIHLPTTARWRGTVVMSAPSMGMQLTLDLSQQIPSRFLLSAPAYLLHHWSAEKTLASHLVPLLDLPGPYPF